jgi:hypothetical protein
MRTHVEFRSNLFPPYPDEDTPNPDLWGKRLAEFLQLKLTEQGIAAGNRDSLFVEDWGVGFHIEKMPFKMWIGCGHYQEWDDGYLVFIEPSKPTIRKGLFGKIDTSAEVERVANAIDRILLNETDVRDVRWWRENEHS